MTNSEKITHLEDIINVANVLIRDVKKEGRIPSIGLAAILDSVDKLKH